MKSALCADEAQLSGLIFDTPTLVRCHELPPWLRYESGTLCRFLHLSSSALMKEAVGDFARESWRTLPWATMLPPAPECADATCSIVSILLSRMLSLFSSGPVPCIDSTAEKHPDAPFPAATQEDCENRQRDTLQRYAGRHPAPSG